MSEKLTKQDLAEMALRESIDDFRRLVKWADDQIGGPSIFPPVEAEPETAGAPAVVEITPVPAAPAEPAKKPAKKKK